MEIEKRITDYRREKATRDEEIVELYKNELRGGHGSLETIYLIQERFKLKSSKTVYLILNAAGIQLQTLNRKHNNQAQ